MSDNTHEHVTADGERIEHGEHYASGLIHEHRPDIMGRVDGGTYSGFTVATSVHYPLRADGSRDPRDAWGLLADAVRLVRNYRKLHPYDEVQPEVDVWLEGEPIAAIVKRQRERDR